MKKTTKPPASPTPGVPGYEPQGRRARCPYCRTQVDVVHGRLKRDLCGLCHAILPGTKPAPEPEPEPVDEPAEVQPKKAGGGGLAARVAGHMNGKGKKARTEPKNEPKTNEKPGEAARKVGWSWRHPGGGYGVLHIVNGEQVEYFVQRMSPNAFTLTKLAPSSTVTYSVVMGKVPTCGCKSYQHQHEGEATCKHIRAMQALKAADKMI
jgi:hypothetical protein